MNQSETIGKLAGALASAQSEMDFAKKDANNPFYHSSYADLASVWDVCRMVLPKNKIAVMQTFGRSERGLPVVRTTLAHESGEWISGEIEMPVAKQNDPQAVGSAITYARRYSLAAIVGVVADDDDGNGAAGNHNQKQQSAPRTQQHTQSQSPKMATQAQITKLIMCYPKGYSDEQRYAHASSVLGRAITSFKELTMKEASDMIERAEKAQKEKAQNAE